MRSTDEIKTSPRMYGYQMLGDIHAAYYEDLQHRVWSLCWDDEMGIEHVSVSCLNKRVMPSWEDMCRFKDLFFKPEEQVVQIHPRASEYVHGVGPSHNRLENILHLWRPSDENWNRLMSM